MRIKLVKELQVKFLQGVRKGTFLADVFNPFLEKHNIPVVLGKEYSDEVLRQPEPEDLSKAAKKVEVVNSKSLF
jgi:hypothetical protein